MSDDDLMPFGKFKGVAMANVPASYLLWLYNQMGASEHGHSKRVQNYIVKNMDVLTSEK